MSNETVNFQINVNGSAITGIAELDKAMGKLSVTANKATIPLEKMYTFGFRINQITDFVRNISDSLNDALQPGIEFDKQLRSLSAITQIVGEDLTNVGNNAKNLASTFGGSASEYVQAFQDTIGALGDSFTDQTAMTLMGENIARLSKLMNGDAKAAANALSTAMLQYGVDLSNPVEASKEATRMMNIMQAAANVGASEVSDTAEALRQSGLLAKQSGLSFEELNASLESLAKGKIVAGEAGTAMRNILLSMSGLSGASKEVRDALDKYGVDVKRVADPTVKFSDRLRELSKIQNDAVLMENVFMKANIAAGSVMLQNIDAIDEYADAVTGTNAAVDGSNIVMESFAERQARVNAKIENFKISLFNATGDVGFFVTALGTALVPLGQLAPILSSLWMGLSKAGKGFINISKSIKTAGGMAQFFKRQTYIMKVQIALLKRDFNSALVSITKLTTIGSGLWMGFTATVKTCCSAIGSAIKKIPIIGWIAAIISLVIVAIKYFDEWGAALDIILGGGIPILGMFMAIYRNWQSIVDAFNSDGATGGIKRIAEVLYSAFTKAIDQIFMKLAEMFPRLAKVFTKVYAVYQVIKMWLGYLFNFIGKIFSFVGEIVNRIGSFIAVIVTSVIEKFMRFVGIIQKVWQWLQSLFQSLANWVKESFRPLYDFFTELWDHIVTIFDKIVSRLGKMFNPIIELWNKISGKTVATYQSGIVAGNDKYSQKPGQSDKKEGGFFENLKEIFGGTLGSGDVVPGVTDQTNSINNKIESGVSGGRSQNNITINMKSGIESVIFEGGLKENKNGLISELEDVINRVLLSGIATARS